MGKGKSSVLGLEMEASDSCREEPLRGGLRGRIYLGTRARQKKGALVVKLYSGIELFNRTEEPPRQVIVKAGDSTTSKRIGSKSARDSSGFTTSFLRYLQKGSCGNIILFRFEQVRDLYRANSSVYWMEGRNVEVVILPRDVPKCGAFYIDVYAILSPSKNFEPSKKRKLDEV